MTFVKLAQAICGFMLLVATAVHPHSQTAHARTTPQATTRLALANAGSTDSQPAFITGTFTYTNDLISKRFYENAVGLMDFRGFVLRDRQFEIPVDGQVLGFLNLDRKGKRADYRLQLPIQPKASTNDVDNNGKRDKGVQIFVLRFFPNIAGGPFAEGDDVYLGWPTFLSSVRASDSDDEVLGGKLIIWSPDDKQMFPSGFGKDNLLFTNDDPVMKVAAGWSVIDLDKPKFGVVRNETVEIKLNEPSEIGEKDYSDLSYTEAFEKLLGDARREYAFNGIEGKEPDWDALEEKLLPKVKQAEEDKDSTAFFEAIREFTMAFNDGHVGMNTDDNAVSALVIQKYIGGTGLVLRELDDGGVIVIDVLPDTPASKSGIEVGATLLEIDGDAVGDAIEQTEPLSGPFSTVVTKRLEQVKYVLHRPVGTKLSLTYQNPKKTKRTVSLTTKFEVQSLFQEDEVLGGKRNNVVLPLEFRIIEQNDKKAGYVRVNSNNDDLNLTFQLFRRALALFEENEIDDLIIDLRFNGGGTGLGLAEFLITKPIVQYINSTAYSPEKDAFVTDTRDMTGTMKPKANGFKLDKLAILVSPSCASACEVESSDLSLVPGAAVIGHYGTAGIFADVARGQYKLPEQISLQLSKIRFTLPNGDLFLEGTGVQPNVRVPMTYDNAINWKQDVVLNVAIETVQE